MMERLAGQSEPLSMFKLAKDFSMVVQLRYSWLSLSGKFTISPSIPLVSTLGRKKAKEKRRRKKQIHVPTSWVCRLKQSDMLFAC